MNTIDIEALLEGRKDPSLEEYGLLIAMAEKASTELLWKLLTSYPKAHWMVKSVLQEPLHRKIPKEKNEQAVNRILQKFQKKLNAS